MYKTLRPRLLVSLIKSPKTRTTHILWRQGHLRRDNVLEKKKNNKSSTKYCIFFTQKFQKFKLFHNGMYMLMFQRFRT